MGFSPAGFAVSELCEVIRRCNPTLDAMQSISWRVEGETESSWFRWIQTVFSPHLLPHLEKVLECSGRQLSKEIILLDAKLNENLPAEPRARSAEAGQFLLQQKTPRGERMIARLQEAIDNGTAFGHFTTLYAVRCGAFSIPVRTAILSYLLQELILGAAKENRQRKGAGPILLDESMKGTVILLEATVESVNESLKGNRIDGIDLSLRPGRASGSSESIRFHG
jgi:hypothetical protein